MTRNSTSIDRETLVAYVDNELPRERAAEVERALASDPEAQEIVRLMRLGGEAAAHAFDQALNEPPPAHLLVALQGPPRMPRSARHRRVFSFSWRMTLAACLASLAIGFAGGLLQRGGDKGYGPAAAKAQDPLATSFESPSSPHSAAGPRGRAMIMATMPWGADGSSSGGSLQPALGPTAGNSTGSRPAAPSRRATAVSPAGALAEAGPS